MNTTQKISPILGLAIILALATGCFPVPPPSPMMEFEIQPSSAAFSGPGERLTFAYLVRNTGEIEFGADVYDNKFGSCSNLIGPVGGLVTCQLSYTTTTEDVAAGSIQVSARAQAHTNGTEFFPNGEMIAQSATAIVNYVAPPVEIYPELTLEVSTSPSAYSKPNEILTFEYTIHNTGTAEIEGPFSILGSSVDQWECDDAGVDGYSLCSDCYLSCKGYYKIRQSDVCSRVASTAHVEGEFNGGLVASSPVSTTVYYSGSCAPSDNTPPTPRPIIIINPWE